MSILIPSVIFGAFVGAIADYWLGRADVQDKKRILIALLLGVIAGVMVFTGHLGYFALV